MKRETFGNVVLLAFLTAQVLDGMFTYWGVTNPRFGLDIEANQLAKQIMRFAGVGFGIIIVKGAASAGGIFLHLHQRHIILALITVLGIVVAIVPWMYIFFITPG